MLDIHCSMFTFGLGVVSVFFFESVNEYFDSFLCLQKIFIWFFVAFALCVLISFGTVSALCKFASSLVFVRTRRLDAFSYDLWQCLFLEM